MPADFRKQIKIGPSARKELMEGINILADAVVCTKWSKCSNWKSSITPINQRWCYCSESYNSRR